MRRARLLPGFADGPDRFVTDAHPLAPVLDGAGGEAVRHAVEEHDKPPRALRGRAGHAGCPLTAPAPAPRTRPTAHGPRPTAADERRSTGTRMAHGGPY